MCVQARLSMRHVRSVLFASYGRWTTQATSNSKLFLSNWFIFKWYSKLSVSQCFSFHFSLSFIWSKECVRQHEKDMELSFAIARSKDKTCGVCFEIITEKIGEQRFGILPNCNHIFCLQCIRKWRLAKQFDNNIIRCVWIVHWAIFILIAIHYLDLYLSFQSMSGMSCDIRFRLPESVLGREQGRQREAHTRLQRCTRKAGL